MERLELWKLLFLVVFLPTLGKTSDICDPTEDGSNSRPETLCDTPYCTCNQPYGRVFCSCLPKNETLAKINRVVVKSTGSCRLPQETRDIEIVNCGNVTFTENAIAPLQNLRTIQVTNAKEVVINRHSFFWNRTTTGISLFVTNTTIAHLPSYAFNGYISKIVFRNVYLGLVKAFAFSSITDTDRIQFVDCNFANIEPQAFKKFATNELQFEKSEFNIIPSRFVHEIHVHKIFRMDSNFINIARTLAFHVMHPLDTIITENRINVIEGDALTVHVRGGVIIRSNIFETIEPGAFKGITTDKRTRFPVPPEVQFDNNTITSYTEASFFFNRPEFTVRFSHMRFDDVCTCDKLAKWKEDVFPSKKQHIPTSIEPHLPDLWCHEDSSKEIDLDFISGEAYYNENCAPIISSLYFFVIVIVSAVVGLCVLIVVALLLIRRRRRWDAVPTTETEGVKLKKDPKKGLVVPDGRVYRETEFHVVVEKVEPMEEAIPYCVTRDRSKSYIREAPR